MINFNGSKLESIQLMVKKILDIPKMRTINVKISDFSTLVLIPKKMKE